jgi:hypothetical protein
LLNVARSELVALAPPSDDVPGHVGDDAYTRHGEHEDRQIRHDPVVILALPHGPHIPGPLCVQRDMTAVNARVDALDWEDLTKQLDERGFAVTTPLLTDAETADLADEFDGGRFRSTIDMARHRFGDGRYRYFEHPLPDTIAGLRGAFYAHLAPVANAWGERIGGDTFPLSHDELIERCREAGQERPTPLILRYGAGDWNALHQDLYGDVYFPFQILTVLTDSHEGGEFVLLENRPRAQSRAHVLNPPKGAFVIFPTRERPELGKRGYYKVGLRHGVSTVTAGSRTALGVIFHDAK